MTRFEWQELEVLSRKLADADDRLAAARSTQNHGLVRLLENEIAAAKVLRDRMVLEMAARLASSPNSPPRREAAGVATNASMPAPQAEAIDGVDLVWNLLRRTEIEHVKCELAGRRSEMMARHAEELRVLDGDEAEIDTFAQAIDTFTRKFQLDAELASVDHPSFSQAG